MKITTKQIEKNVKQVYNKKALEYIRVFGKNPNYLVVLKKIYKKIPKGSKVLDVGCGAGLPVSKFLAKRFDVLGIDITDKMIGLAKKNVPNAKFKKMNMINLKFKPETFDLICSFFSLFHVKKTKIPEILKNFYKFLKKEGYLVIALGELKKNREYFSNFLGKKLYFVEISEDKFKKMLRDIGFKIIYMKHHYYRYGKGKDNVEKELFIIAQK